MTVRMVRRAVRIGLRLGFLAVMAGVVGSGGVIALGDRLSSGIAALAVAATAPPVPTSGGAMLIMQHALTVRHEHASWER